jgi:hypothetical protein
MLRRTGELAQPLQHVTQEMNLPGAQTNYW